MRLPSKFIALAALVAALTSCTTVQPAQSPVVVSNEVGNGSAAQAAELTALDKLTAAVARAESFAKAAAVAAQSVKASTAAIARDLKSITQEAPAPAAQPAPQPKPQPVPAASSPAGLTEGP